jgi:hypothetical protein
VSLPTLIVEAGFTGADTGTYLVLNDPARGRLDTGTLAPDGIFTDISAYVMAMSTSRVSNRIQGPIIRYEAGTCTVLLNNDDRRFDPTWLAGPYVTGSTTNVKPMRPIRIRATWAGAIYEVFRGYADSWQVAYDREFPFSSRVTLTATDATKVLSRINRAAVAAVGAGENTGVRINRILDSASWSAVDRLVAVDGDTTVQSTTLDGPAWDEMMLNQDTEVGELYIDAGGRVFFRSRRALLTDPRSIYANTVFGDQPATGVQTTINIVLNPSSEVSIFGWHGGGSVSPTLSQSSAQARFGTKSLLVTWGTGGTLPQVSINDTAPDVMVTAMTVGRIYTASVYVYVPSGSPDVALVTANYGFGEASGGTTLKDQWVRLFYTWTAATTSWPLQLWPLQSPTAGQQVYIDGLQIEEGATATTYCDGTQTGCEWDGAAHLTSSRRLPELPYSEVGVEYDDSTLANAIRVTRAGGAEQVAQSPLSQSEYFTATWVPSTQPIMQTDTNAYDYARFILGQMSEPELRFSTLAIQGQRDETNLFPQALGRQIGDRIRIIRRPPGGGSATTREGFIRGIEHSFDGEDWVTRFTLQSATRYQFLVLDHATLGQLDANRLAF